MTHQTLRFRLGELQAGLALDFLRDAATQSTAATAHRSRCENPTIANDRAIRNALAKVDDHRGVLRADIRPCTNRGGKWLGNNENIIGTRAADGNFQGKAFLVSSVARCASQGTRSAPAELLISAKEMPENFRRQLDLHDCTIPHGRDIAYPRRCRRDSRIAPRRTVSIGRLVTQHAAKTD